MNARPFAEALRETIVGLYMPPPETAALHEQIAAALAAGAPSEQVDALMTQCPDSECAVCGSLCCPHGEPLHFHHDGCPACWTPEPYTQEQVDAMNAEKNEAAP